MTTTETTKFNSPTASAFRRPTFTRAQLSLMAALNQEGIAYRAEEPFERPGEFNKGGIPRTYVVDIFIPPSLCIEVDGAAHHYSSRISKDEKKEAWFEKKGFTMLRFSNKNARFHTSDVIRAIKATMELLK